MHRYIAIAWNPLSSDARGAAYTLIHRLTSALVKWQCALAADGLHVYHAGAKDNVSRAYELTGSAGVILGKLFSRAAAVSGQLDDVCFGYKESIQVHSTQGQRLIEDYWGRYVAFLPEPDSTQVRVLRDPTGAAPCFHYRFQKVDIFFSDISDCTPLQVIDSAINWDHITEYLWLDRPATSDTGIKGVRQIQAGECVVAGQPTLDSSYYWHPARIYDKRVVDNRQQAMCELKSTVQNCVAAWACCYDSVLHSLSGGLDSAIVAGCLSAISSDVEVVCENYYTERADGDERSFARRAAARAGFELIETALRVSDRPLTEYFDSRRRATPTLTPFAQDIELVREALVKDRGFEAFFSGQGGDHFFQHNRTTLIAADFASRYGMRTGLLRTVFDTAKLTRKPIWEVMSAVVVHGFLGKPPDPYLRHQDAPLLISDATRNTFDLSRIRHAWIDDARHLPGAKILQVYSILDSQKFHRHRCSYADTVHPLISQPIIELCLQIPSYLLSYGGMDRALARDTFSGLIPPEIAARTTKGDTGSYFNQLFVRNLPCLRELLLDGVLIAEGILDREDTEASLTESQLISNPRLTWPIINALRAESWSRAWIGQRQSVAA